MKQNMNVVRFKCNFTYFACASIGILILIIIYNEAKRSSYGDGDPGATLDTYEDDFDEADTSYTFNFDKNNVDPNFKTAYDHEYTLHSTLQEKCQGPVPDIVFLVHSNSLHMENRYVIRHTWGAENRVGYTAVIRTVFLVQVSPNENYKRLRLFKENSRNIDMLVSVYDDTADNKSVNSIIALKWVHDYCNNAKFYIFTNEDTYINTKILIDYLSNIDSNNHITNYTHFFKNVPQPPNGITSRMKSREFFGGHLVVNSVVERVKKGLGNKITIGEDEYPYNMYNPYLKGPLIIFTRPVVLNFLEAAKYTRIFRLEDVYLGLLAAWSKTPLTYVPGIEVNSQMSNIDTEIAVHKIGTPELLEMIWRSHKNRGQN